MMLNTRRVNTKKKLMGIMMSKIFRLKIVDKQSEKQFSILTKEKWYSPWNERTYLSYAHTYNGTKLQQQQEIIKRAELLMEDDVVLYDSRE